jgi:hypothetical protein
MSTRIEHGEFRQDSAKFLVKRVLGKLDFPHVKIADTADLEVLVNDLLVFPVNEARCVP